MFVSIEDARLAYVKQRETFFRWLCSLDSSSGSAMSLEYIKSLIRRAQVHSYQDCRDRESRLWGMQMALGLNEAEINEIDQGIIGLLK